MRWLDAPPLTAAAVIVVAALMGGAFFPGPRIAVGLGFVVFSVISALLIHDRLRGEEVLLCAFAGWAGKRLPTVFHWNRAALPFAASQVVPPSNLAGTGTVPVGTTHSVNRFGVHDLAGNVREWARNEVTPDGQRFILGGGWNDPEYAFADAYAQSPWDRSAANGFRCMRNVEDEGAEGDDPLARTTELLRKWFGD